MAGPRSPSVAEGSGRPPVAPVRAADASPAGRPASAPPSGEQVASGILEVLGPLRRLLRRAVRLRAPVTPLPTAQVELLRVVEEHPRIAVRDAASVLRLAANSVSTLVNQLVEAGLLERGKDPDDRRSASLVLTPRATDRFELWRDRRQEVLSAAVAELTPEDRERIGAALPALVRLVSTLEPMA